MPVQVENTTLHLMSTGKWGNVLLFEGLTSSLVLGRKQLRRDGRSAGSEVKLGLLTKGDNLSTRI